ncbi:MAG: D-alanyl-D-alanine carboxypeptidase/D-alanyl-D-alanine-endopeptidase (penicillin-binding protein 4) [Myxococcota bacterium]|jgi:D-alanyl-D-alanine carboxypeptidase/D-alanyl-D-alanine-endopeptidase (penicillin-binding protein 4)
MISLLLGCVLNFVAVPQQSLESLISKVDNERALELSVMVQKLDGEVLFSHKPQRDLTIASNTKLFTTAAALIELGADFRWQTKVLLDGNNLAIVGGGDPSLAKFEDKDFAQLFIIELLQTLRSSSVSHVDSLYIDASAFDEQRHPLWPLEHRYDYFCAPPTALSVNSGCIDIDYDGAKALFYPPLVPSVNVRYYGKTSKFLSAWWADNGATLWVRTSPGKKQVAKYAVPDGVQFFGWWVHDQLELAGIKVGQVVVQRMPETATQKLILDYSSALSLADVVLEINKESNNFMAEMVLKTLGAKKLEVGSYANGASAIKEILSGILPNITQLSQLDGSGMARSSVVNNVASPQLLCELLREMCFMPVGEQWFESLAIGGVDGTLSNRFLDAAFHPQRIHAKTGFIQSKQSSDGFGASSLSGYLLLPDDQIAVFSFVVNFRRKINSNTNNRRFKSLQQQFFKQLIEDYNNERSKNS